MIASFEVIAEPNRRRILELLGEGERPVGELVGQLKVSQPAVSKHLRILRQAGLVDTLPSRIAFPATPPHRPSAMIDYLFVLEEQILRGRPRVLH